MKKVLIAFILVLLLPTIQLHAQEKDSAQAEPAIKLELIYKKELGELMVGPEGFPPPEIKQVLKGEDIPQEDKDWVLNSLRLEIARREKVLYTNDGNAIKLPGDLQGISTSKNLKYMIAHAANIDYGGLTAEEVRKLSDTWFDAGKRMSEWQTLYEKATDPAEKQQFNDSMRYWVTITNDLGVRLRTIEKNTKEYKKFILMQLEDGKVLWDREDIQIPDYISDDGKAIVAVPGVGEYGHLFTTIYFYDEKGNEKKRESGHLGLRSCFDMSVNGGMFCVITRKGVEDTLYTAVVAYDINGNELWNTRVLGYWPSSEHSIVVSDKHKFIAVSLDLTPGGAFTYLFDERGKIINKFGFRTRVPIISGHEEYLLCSGVNNNIFLIKTQDGEIVWKKHINNLMSGSSIPDDGEYIYVNVSGTPPKTLCLNKNGDLLAELEAYSTISPSGKIVLNSEGIYKIGGRNEK